MWGYCGGHLGELCKNDKTKAQNDKTDVKDDKTTIWVYGGNIGVSMGYITKVAPISRCYFYITLDLPFTLLL